MTSVLANNGPFQMAGARGILERAGGALQIRQQVEAIEEAVYDRPAMVFDLAKALVETISKTILDELGVGYDNNFDAPRLLRETLMRLQLFPIQTYKSDIPGLFIYNELLVISDGLEARGGTLTSGWDRFMPWRTIDGKEVAPRGSVELEVLLKGVFDKPRFLDLVLNFMVFDDDGADIAKKAAAYHQFHAVNKAVECTLSACGIDAESGMLYARFPEHDEHNPFEVREPQAAYGSGTEHFGGRRIGVIWHTQGSGKSLLMTFFAGKVIRHPAMENPTLLMITDRNDLDDQLFGTFSSCRDLLRQTPVQAENREHLKELLQVPAGGRGKAAVNQEEAVAVMLEKFDVVVSMFHGFDYPSILKEESAKRLKGIAAAMEHILQLDDGKKRYLTEVTALSKAFALAVPHEEALKIRDEVGFFQEVRAGLAKATVEGEGKAPEEMDTAIRQLVSRAVASDEVIDIFAAAGLKKPDISILSDDFLQEVRQLPHRNLAVELLRKLLNDEIKTNSRKNVVQARSFAEMLEKAIRKYQNRAIEAAQVIEELIKLAKEMREAQRRGDDLGMTDDEIAFYDALEVNDSAVKVLGDETLKTIAHELVEAVRRSVTIDWTVRENARAQIRVIVKRILRKYGYPPDKQEKATQTVLEQAEVLCREWLTE